MRGRSETFWLVLAVAVMSIAGGVIVAIRNGHNRAHVPSKGQPTVTYEQDGRGEPTVAPMRVAVPPSNERSFRIVDVKKTPITDAWLLVGEAGRDDYRVHADTSGVARVILADSKQPPWVLVGADDATPEILAPSDPRWTEAPITEVMLHGVKRVSVLVLDGFDFPVSEAMITILDQPADRPGIERMPDRWTGLVNTRFKGDQSGTVVVTVKADATEVSMSASAFGYFPESARFSPITQTDKLTLRMRALAVAALRIRSERVDLPVADQGSLTTVRKGHTWLLPCVLPADLDGEIRKWLRTTHGVDRDGDIVWDFAAELPDPGDVRQYPVESDFEFAVFGSSAPPTSGKLKYRRVVEWTPNDIVAIDLPRKTEEQLSVAEIEFVGVSSSKELPDESWHVVSTDDPEQVYSPQNRPDFERGVRWYSFVLLEGRYRIEPSLAFLRPLQFDEVQFDVKRGEKRRVVVEPWKDDLAGEISVRLFDKNGHEDVSSCRFTIKEDGKPGTVPVNVKRGTWRGRIKPGEYVGRFVFEGHTSETVRFTVKSGAKTEVSFTRP